MVKDRLENDRNNPTKEREGFWMLERKRNEETVSIVEQLSSNINAWALESHVAVPHLFRNSLRTKKEREFLSFIKQFLPVP